MDEFAEINVTPFTDVLLVLLIIFMVLAALIIPAGFEKQLNNCSKSCLGPEVALNAPADLSIAQSGAMTLDGRAIDQRAIYGALSQLHAARPHVKLAIYGDAKAPYRFVVRVLDAAKAAAIDNVSFITK